MHVSFINQFIYFIITQVVSRQRILDSTGRANISRESIKKQTQVHNDVHLVSAVHINETSLMRNYMIG
jgi:hypothetical protein